jgi:hypothetical protein
MAIVEMWTLSVETVPNIDLTGFKVEATDGEIGKVDEATKEVGESFIIVDTGPWIFGKKIMVPRPIRDIDPDTRRSSSTARRTNQNAPEFDETRYHDQAYRDELAGYYNRGAMRSGEGM